MQLGEGCISDAIRRRLHLAYHEQSRRERDHEITAQRSHEVHALSHPSRVLCKGKVPLSPMAQLPALSVSAQ